jgi:hypothetical protein
LRDVVGDVGENVVWKKDSMMRSIAVFDNDDDDDDNKPVWSLGLWAPFSEGRDVSTSTTYVVKTTYPFVIEESGHPR